MRTTFCTSCSKTKQKNWTFIKIYHRVHVCKFVQQYHLSKAVTWPRSSLIRVSFKWHWLGYIEEALSNNYILKICKYNWNWVSEFYSSRNILEKDFRKRNKSVIEYAQLKLWCIFISPEASNEIGKLKQKFPNHLQWVYFRNDFHRILGMKSELSANSLK